MESFAGPAQLHPPGTDRAATEELLAGLGFAEPARSYDVLGASSTRRRVGKVLANLFPLMAPASRSPPTPTRRSCGWNASPKRWAAGGEPAQTLLATDPVAARRLAHVAAASSFATDLLVADPARIRASADTLLGGETDAAGDLVDAVARTAAASSRRARRATALAGGRATRSLARRASTAPRGPRDLPFAVIGMGKLGARELNVASDLDLMFVYEGEGAEAQRRAGGLAERALQRSARRVGARRRPAPRRSKRTAGPIDRRLPRVLAAVRGDLGVPGAAAGPRRRGRPLSSGGGSS